MLSRLTRFARAGLALTAAAVALGAFAAAGSAAPKPGFLPGTWIGQGTISGSVDDGPMSAFFNGRISFTMKVSKSLGVSGTGNWKLDMLGSQDAPSEYGVDATIVGAANIALKGTGTNVTFSGTQRMQMQFRTGGQTKLGPVTEKPLNGRLVITRAGKCRVVGATVIQPGVTLNWRAKLKGSGTCNA